MGNDSSWASKSRQQYKFAHISEYEQTNINREEGHSSHAQSSMIPNSLTLLLIESRKNIEPFPICYVIQEVSKWQFQLKFLIDDAIQC